MEDYTATYSPEDNKLRLTSTARLDEELYAKAKALGFRWAPKQGIFFAPGWSPARETFLLELCGEIGDEDSTLIERAEERSDRFQGYKESRTKDAQQAEEGVKTLTDNIPFGQPILVGHHSERKARKDAEKIENGMRKAVKMWDTAQYWQDRARGAIRHAKYKELPSVRARRIKKLEAQKRKEEKEQARSQLLIKLWSKPDLTMENALKIANHFDHLSVKFPADKYPKSTYEGSQSLWGGLEKNVIDEHQAQAIALPIHARTVKYCQRWIDHLENRLTYEKTMLGNQGKLDLIKPKVRPKQLPLVNYRAPEGISIENIYTRGEVTTYPQIEMTKKEYQDLYEGNRWTATVDNSHRVRVYIKTRGGIPVRSCVFLTDSKTHTRPDPIDPEPKGPRFPRIITKEESKSLREEKPEIKDQAKTMCEALAQGVKIAVAPQLYPTPPNIVETMILYANIQLGMDVLEPSAGTGNILKALPDVKAGGAQGTITAVEINYNLANNGLEGLADEIINKDFLECENIGTFDRILMNPPFEKGVDIKHIKHALTMLKDGGRLVAICANGSRQQEAFKDIATHWEDLPEGSFKNAGTNVNTALIVLNK